jgi:hypothetical protein
MSTKLVQLSNISRKKTQMDSSPVGMIEKDTLVLIKNKESEEIYKNFNDKLSIYLSKIKNQSSSICSMLLNKDIIYLGMLSKANTAILGTYATEGEKISAIVLNVNNLDMDFKTGEIFDPENINYIIYFQFIRAITEIFFKEIERNTELNNYLIEYLSYLFMKNLKLPMLNDKQVELLKFIIGVMYYKCYYKYNDTLAIEKCESLISKDFYDEFKTPIKNSNIPKYSEIKDIIKLLSEFKITFEPPNQLLYNLLLSLKTIGVLLITSDIGNLIACSILSQYPCDYYSSLFINRVSQSKIESIISNFYSKVAFQKLI